jgi:hypothetical protein
VFIYGLFGRLFFKYLSIPHQIHRFRELLDSPELSSFTPIPLPLDPDVKIKGVVVGTPEESKSCR